MTGTMMTMLLLAGCLTAALCAPAPAAGPNLKESPSNKVIVDDEEYLSQEERERIVAGIILQIARDFDQGYITQDELEGRSSVRHDDVLRKDKSASETGKEKTPPQTSPASVAMAAAT